jgi:hypothetical protein
VKLQKHLKIEQGEQKLLKTGGLFPAKSLTSRRNFKNVKKKHMKLTRKENIRSADKNRLADNEIYSAFQATYNGVFEDVPDINIGQCSIENGIFKYKESEKEKYFYKKKYIGLRKKCINLDALGIIFPNDINKDTIGNTKRDLLDFVYNNENEVSLQFEGDRGWGKTTILRYLFFHIIPQLNEINEKKIIPIYVSFNEVVNSLGKKEGDKEILDKFYGILSDIIKHYYTDILSDLTSEFWENYLITKSGFGDYKIKLERLKGFTNNSDKQDKERIFLHDELLKIPDAILHCFAHAAKIRDRSIPVIILDDLEPLKTSVVNVIFNEIYKINHSFGIKVIYAIRPITAKKIRRISDFTNNFCVRGLNKPELLEIFLDIYMRIFIDKIDNNNVTEIKLDNRIVKISESKKFYLNFLTILKQERSSDLLENIADGNIRIYKELVKTCLCSGFIKSEGLIAKLLDDDYIGVQKSFPYWMVYTCIITQNYKLLFHDVVKQGNSEHVINLLCNGGEHFHTYLIRLHLLSFLVKRGNAGNSYKDIKKTFEGFFNKNDFSNLSKSLCRALKKLNDPTDKRAGLIENEDKLSIKSESESEFENKNYEFKVTDVGRYYYHKFITTFEYLSFMKDDVDFPRIIADNINNNIEATSPQDRFNAIEKYLDFLFEEEKKFITSLKQKTKLQTYKDYFSPSETGKLLFSELFVDSMIAYAEPRIDISDNSIRTLKGKINSYKISLI